MANVHFFFHSCIRFASIRLTFLLLAQFILSCMNSVCGALGFDLVWSRRSSNSNSSISNTRKSVYLPWVNGEGCFKRLLDYHHWCEYNIHYVLKYIVHNFYSPFFSCCVRVCVSVCEWVNVSVAPHVVSVHFHQKACTAKRQWHFYTDMNWIGYRQESSNIGNGTYSTCTYRTIYVILFNNRCGIDLMFRRELRNRLGEM